LSNFKNLKRKAKNFLYNSANSFLYSCRLTPRSCVNDKEIRILGLQRTGNHAVINWIFTQAPEVKCYLNSVKPDTDPFLSFERRGTVREFQKDFFTKFNIGAERLGFFCPKKLLVYSYEEEFIQDVFSSAVFEANHDRWTGKSAERFDMIILRDPFNLFASRLKKEEDINANRYSLKKDGEKETVIEIWKSYAREFIGETKFLKNKKLMVNYNKWFLEKEYRKELAEKLGLEFSDSAIDQVLPIGGGSSFDRTSKDSSATEMKVLERWAHYKDDENFINLFKDRELVELSEKIFGRIPGTEIFNI